MLENVDSSPSSKIALFVHCHVQHPIFMFFLFPILDNCFHNPFFHTVSYAEGRESELNPLELSWHEEIRRWGKKEGRAGPLYGLLLGNRFSLGSIFRKKSPNIGGFRGACLATAVCVRIAHLCLLEIKQ